MPVTTTYPGVYVEELAGMALSVSSNATAVPVFAIANGDLVFTDPVTRISSWLDYMSHLGEVQFDPTNIRDISLRTYFENGGGYCYLVETSKMQAEVPKLDDATLLVSAGQNLQSVVAALCGEGKNLFAILDGPNDDIANANQDRGEQEGKGPTWADLYDETPHAAIYYPWLTSDWTDQNIPPSAAIAGAYCRNDNARGVWKAPANIMLQGGVLPAFKVTDDFQGQHTWGGKALNMIRQFNNGSPLIWGARTCEDTDSWRYIPVRRLFNSAEKNIKDTMRFVMYEPNNQPTWGRVRAAITNYLYGLWKQGGLMGSKPEEAYFVQIGLGVTMTEDDINQGKMIVKVGMAAVRPAEFIVLQFTQDVAQ
ncbi:phage tail protein [Burkholderia ubonensis]|uniref:phage tail sheath family protein n=1 Tax=Burkholderia ubonensis TaxID=101571 RepID=UPI00075EEB98|nr:phage tail sheath C-terminal domain-containing protein [Burkholderia ubonensis]KWI32628.1 phage tail protein [Burkholderia ubonensis]OJB13505.1 phage tail protein [Burkholderia ubonensis]